MTSPAHASRVAVITLGCAKNTADTDLLAGQILREGMEITGELDSADAMIVNTCAFLTAAEEESIDVILQMAEQKRSRPEQRLVVVGCLAQRHAGKLLEEIPEIDLLVGPGEVHTLAPRLGALIAEGRTDGDRVRLGGTESIEERWDLRVVSPYPQSAYVKISEGCSRPCTFCIIPKLRGEARSRSRESILREVQYLAGGGVKEVNLVAQDLTSYGIDRYDHPTLADLLGDLQTVDALHWIRLLYTYPAHWSEDLLAAVRELTRVVSYIDMPIQHVSDRILRAMRRPPSRSTRALLDRLKSAIPSVVVRTTLMVGFPGETDQEFEEMLAFVRDYRFDCMGVFAFSPEEGTEAAGYEGRLPEELAEQRRQRLLAAQQEVSRERNRARIGEVLTILLEAVDGEGVAAARHAGQAPEVDGTVRLHGAGRLGVGDMVQAKIIAADAYDLEARLAGEREIG